MNANHENLRNACQGALAAFHKLGSLEYAEIESKLEFVIGSYNFDKNPVGLYEIGALALEILNGVREKSPRKVSKKIITDLESGLKE